MLARSSRLLPSLSLCSFFFFFNDPSTTEIYTLSLHDALPISARNGTRTSAISRPATNTARKPDPRSEEHTSELQSHHDLVCRLLLEKKKRSLINHARSSRKHARARRVRPHLIDQRATSVRTPC